MTARLALRNLLRNPRRTLLVFVTLAAGAGALFAFRAFNAGLLAEYREVSIRSRYGHGTFFTKGYWGKSLEEPWKRWISDPAPLLDALRGTEGVGRVFPRVSFSALVTAGGAAFNGVGLGIDGKEEGRFFDRLLITEGAFLDGRPEGILLGKGLAKALGARPGTAITLLANTVHGSLNAGTFTVTGVFETGIKAIDDVAFRTELAAAQKLLDTAAVESVSVALADGVPWSRVAGSFAGRADLEALSFEEMDRTYYQNGVLWLKKQAGVFELIILFIVLLGVFNAVAVSILERSAEFATARANGEGRGDIFKGLLVEVVALGAVAAAAGMAGTWVLGQSLLAKGIPMPPPPGMTLPSLVFLQFGWTDAAAVGAACVATVAVGASLMAARALGGPITRSLRSL